MQYNIDFIVIDARQNKSKKLPNVAGLKIYSIDTSELIETIEAKFNEEFMESRGKDHFLFLLNSFSFENSASFDS